MGLGAIAGQRPRFLGMLGMHGTYEANMTMQNCDVLLAVGARFDDRVIGNPKHFASVERKIIHVDIDPSSISKRVKVDIPIVGDVKDVLQELIAQIKEAQARPDAAARCRPGGARSTSGASASAWPTSTARVIKPQMVVEKLWQLTKDRDTYITVRRGPAPDVGGAVLPLRRAAALDQLRRPGHHGRGPALCDGHQAGQARLDVFCITGEGSIQMCIQELSTCLQYKTPVKIVSLNNRYLGMVRQWQQLDYGGRYSHSYMDALPDFVKLAEAYGHVGLLVEKPGDVEGALREAIRLKDRTVFLDVRTDPTENVWPMVQAGKGITEMLLGSEDL
jgi:acetolactate synthase-1/2/3 large subunit